MEVLPIYFRTPIVGDSSITTLLARLQLSFASSCVSITLWLMNMAGVLVAPPCRLHTYTVSSWDIVSYFVLLGESEDSLCGVRFYPHSFSVKVSLIYLRLARVSLLDFNLLWHWPLVVFVLDLRANRFAQLQRVDFLARCSAPFVRLQGRLKLLGFAVSVFHWRWLCDIYL